MSEPVLEKIWFVMLVERGAVYPETPGPVLMRYKAPDQMRWAIVKAETRYDAIERAREGTELEPYAAALLCEYERL